jgi:tRNA(Ile2) C34 agmatinyltransferase TiaS
MQITSRTTIVRNADVISGILNWVCPGCGGRMGGRNLEFKCQGECLTDWRPIWERALSEGSRPSKH